MEEKLSAYEQLDLEERRMHKEYQEKFYQLDLHERKQETVRRGLEILTKLLQCDKNRMETHLEVLDNKVRTFLKKLAPHE